MSDAAIYRAPMRSGVEHALEQGLVGIESGSDERSARRLHRFATLPEGVFVWTRDPAGGYHLGRITGPVREAGAKHVRPTDWLERVFSDAEVPPAVAKTFARGGRNFQRTHDRDAERQTAALWTAERG